MYITKMDVYYYDLGQSEPRLVLSDPSEQKCRKAAAEALGRSSLRGCPKAGSDRGVFFYEPGVAYEKARSVELVS